jgi:hypothetical protein
MPKGSLGLVILFALHLLYILRSCYNKKPLTPAVSGISNHTNTTANNSTI